MIKLYWSERKYTVCSCEYEGTNYIKQGRIHKVLWFCIGNTSAATTAIQKECWKAYPCFTSTEGNLQWCFEGIPWAVWQRPNFPLVWTCGLHLNNDIWWNLNKAKLSTNMVESQVKLRLDRLHQPCGKKWSLLIHLNKASPTTERGVNAKGLVKKLHGWQAKTLNLAQV